MFFHHITTMKSSKILFQVLCILSNNYLDWSITTISVAVTILTIFVLVAIFMILLVASAVTSIVLYCLDSPLWITFLGTAIVLLIVGLLIVLTCILIYLSVSRTRNMILDVWYRSKKQINKSEQLYPIAINITTNITITTKRTRTL